MTINVEHRGVFILNESDLIEFIDKFLDIKARAEALAAENQRLKQALAHQIYRNHDYAEACDGCRGWKLAVAG